MHKHMVEANKRVHKHMLKVKKRVHRHMLKVKKWSVFRRRRKAAGTPVGEKRWSDFPLRNEHLLCPHILRVQYREYVTIVDSWENLKTN